MPGKIAWPILILLLASFAAAQTQWMTSFIPAGIYDEGYDTWEGNQFRANSRFPIVGLCFYQLAGVTQAHTVGLFNSSGSVLTTTSVPLASANAWACAPLNTPYEVQAGIVYNVAAFFHGGIDHSPDCGSSYAVSAVASMVNGIWTDNYSSGSGSQDFQTYTAACGASFLYGPAALAITNSAPNGIAGTAINFQFVATGGSESGYSWQLLSGTLPPNLSLSGGGILSGNPTTANTYNYSVRVTDSASNHADLAVSQTIFPSSGGGQPSGTEWIFHTKIQGAGTPVTEIVNRWVGITIVAHAPVPVTGLCRLAVAGNSGVHPLQIFSRTVTNATTGTGTPLGETVISNAGSTARTWVCGALSPPINLTRGTEYYIAGFEGQGDSHYPCNLAQVVLVGHSEIGRVTNALTSSTVAANPAGTQTFTNSSRGVCPVGLYFGTPALYIHPTAAEGDPPVPNGVRTKPYTHVFKADGGSGSGRNWTQTAGTLPPGLVLTGNGTLSGTPSTAGVYTYTLAVTDSITATPVTRILTQVIFNPTTSIEADNRYCSPGNEWTGGAMDQWAYLPKHCINTDMAYTPSWAAGTAPNPGPVVSLPSGNSLSTAINNATCGTVIKLAAGGTYNMPTGLPSKNCDDGHWITIESDALANLPAQGIRISPCYAGVANLPFRPAFPCPSGGAHNYMPTVYIRPNYYLSYDETRNIDHFRFIGLNITRNPNYDANGAGGGMYGFMYLGSGEKIIFDRCWIHGVDIKVPNGATGSGLNVYDTNYTAVIDSYVNDFWSTGRQGPSQAYALEAGIYGGYSGKYWGTLKWVNNYLEASGHSSFFGGAGGGDSFYDLEIRRNFMYKPLNWLETWINGGSTVLRHPLWNGGDCMGTAGNYTCGYAPQVQTLFETKNASRMLFEGNIEENVWTGYGQTGWCMEWNANDQDENFYAATNDITARYDRCTNAGMVLGFTKYGSAYQLARHSMHDIIFDHIDWPYLGDSTNQIVQIMNEGRVPGEQINNLYLNHLTFVHEPNNRMGQYTSILELINFGGTVNQMYNFVFKNSIMRHGEYGLKGGCNTSGGGGLTSCFAGVLQWGNNLVAGPGSASNMPALGGIATNKVVANQNAIGYTDMAAGNYKLLSTSPGYNAADDKSSRPLTGQDIGADTELVALYTCNVETGLPCGEQPPPPPPPPITVSVLPSNIPVQVNQTQQFTPTVSNATNPAVSWSLNPSSGRGTINQSGVYTAPASVPGTPTVTVIAASVEDPTKNGTATVTIQAAPEISINILPPSASVEVGLTQAFFAEVTGSVNQAVNWSVNGGSTNGTISSTGLYTAPGSVPSPATVTITATSQADVSKTATAPVTVTATAPPITVSVLPSNPTVEVNQIQQFTANVTGTANTAVNWEVDGLAGGGSSRGTISNTGLYTAPASVPSPATRTITAVSQADSSKNGTAAVTIIPATLPPAISIHLTPSHVIVNAGTQTQFTANVTGTSNTAVNWNTAHPAATIDNGLFTAPDVTVTTLITVTATSVADPSVHQSAVATVEPRGTPPPPGEGCTIVRKTLPPPIR